MRVEPSLDEERAMLAAVLASIGDAVISTDSAGRVTSLNQAAESLTGWTQAAALGRPLSEVYRTADCTTREPLESPVLRALREEAPVEFGERALLAARDGTEHTVEDSATPLPGRTRRAIGAILVFRNLTPRLDAERAQARLATIVASSHDAIVSKSLDGIIDSWNAEAERLFGYTAAEAVGRPITMIIPPERLDEEREIMQQLRRGQRVDHFETVRVTKSGRRIDISLTISPMRDASGRIIGASKVARDITDRKQAEQLLREADRRKDEFLALLAHELRNPLAPLQNGLHIMRLAGSDGRTFEQAQGMMERQLAHLVRLVDDLLDVSRISQGKLQLRRTRIAATEILDSAVETARPAIEAEGHHLTISLPPEPIHVLADSTRLAQVFGNLLSNSAKYTRPGGHIFLATERQGEELVVSVRDTGIGIPAEALPRIFDMFAQVDRSIERTTGGLGIGLALVKGLVEMHGGTVRAESGGPGEGSTFTVRLPIQKGEVDDAGAVVPPQGGHGQRRRILVVDDNHDAAHSMSTLLKLLGNEVQAAHDGLSAVEAAERFRPDVVIMDIGMPRLNGYEATRRIRAQPWGKDMLVIALTGWGQESDRAASDSAGCDAHLVKPLNVWQLEPLLAGLQRGGAAQP